MRGGSSRAIMSLAFASRRGLSLMTPFPTMLVRSRPAFTPSVPAATPPSSRGVLARTTWSNTCENHHHHPVQVAAQLRALVAPLSMAAASSETGGGSPKKSAGGSNKRKPRHASSSSATSSPRGAKRRLSSGPEGGSAASPRTVPWGTGAAEGVGGRGRGQASAGGRGAAVSAGAGRGGRGTIARGLHDRRPYTPRPKSFGEVPEDQLQVSFTRASGAGGQNVNKVSTKVEMRFVVSEAEWLPYDVRLRLARQEKGRMNNKGELVVTAQETQKQNRSQALAKLREMINEAWEPAKERKMRTGIGKKGKAIRKQDKLHRSKASRTR
ncbi:unnamed protein product, partial [Ectocarpus sp. 8 AP-2014]